MLKIKCSITFPCTEVEWNKLCQIKSLAGNALIVSHQTSKPIDASPLAEKLTAKESKLMDDMSQATHEKGTTPFMDALEAEGNTNHLARKGSPGNTSSIRSLATKFLSENGGSAPRENIVQYIVANRSDMTRQTILTNLYANFRGVKKENGIWHLPIVAS